MRKPEPLLECPAGGRGCADKAFERADVIGMRRTEKTILRWRIRGRGL